MAKYRTVAEYQEIVRKMPTQEVVGLAETYNECKTLGVKDVLIKDILNAEMERRIYNWEAVQV